MTRTGTLVLAHCAVWATLVGSAGIAWAQTSTWQPVRSGTASSAVESEERGEVAPQRWIAPTQKPSNRKAAPKTAKSTAQPVKSTARQPNPFVPPADARQLTSNGSANQSAARTSSNKLPSQNTAAKQQPQATGSSSAALKSPPTAKIAATPDRSKSAEPAKAAPQRTQPQQVRSKSRPRPSSSNRLFDDSWIRPLKQAAYQSGEPEELYSPSPTEMEMPPQGEMVGPGFQPDGEWIGTPDGMPYGGPCCDGGCGPQCDCGPGCSCGPMCGDGCCEPSCGCGSRGCGTDSCHIDLALGLDDPEACEEIRFRVPKAHTLMLNGGVHGFKGPYDWDRNSGNFGFQEGINVGFKVPLSEFGYQIGYQTMQSQLNGDSNTGIGEAFSQHFFTLGVFRRTPDGFQGGIAWDHMFDERNTSVDFSQLRAEVGFVDCGCHEVGVMAAVHLSDEWFVDDEDAITTFQATDQYLLYYRMHGKRGGEGRAYAGINDDSDGIVGADFLLPLTESWSLQPEFTYLIPENGGGELGARQEAWNISINLVWHWKGQARSCHSSPYRPLFNVADNGSMIIDDRP